MSHVLTSAFACSFRWTTVDANDVKVDINGSTYNGALTTTDARILLGHGTTATTTADYETLPEFLAYLQARVNAVITGSTLTLALDPSGYVTYSFSGGSTWKIYNDSASKPWRLLGFTSNTYTAQSGTAEQPPRYLALAMVWTGPSRWRLASPWASEISASGRGFGTLAGSSGADVEGTVDLVPYDPDAASSAFSGVGVTPLWPAEANLASLGAHTGVWSWADLAVAGANQRWGFALGTLQDVIASSSKRFDLGGIDPSHLAAMRPAALVETYLDLERFPLRLVRRTDTPTTTRA